MHKFNYEKDSKYLRIYNTDDEKFNFFWETTSIYSQWHPSSFEIENVKFKTAEHYMMYQKALTFKQPEIAEKILVTNVPRDVKALGRSIKNFDNKKWDEVKIGIVFDANLAKFNQNEKLLSSLLLTEGQTLVEASPYDVIWGIGLVKEDTDAMIRENWRGENLLGRVLTELRYDITGKY